VLDPHKNSQLCGWLDRDDVRVLRHSDGTILAIDPSGFARFSDPTSVAAVDDLAGETAGDVLAVVRGPVAAADAFVALRRDPEPWTRIFEGIEMVALDEPQARDVPGELHGAAQHPGISFADWRAAFTEEAFTTGGEPPPVALDQLHVWVVDGTPRSMAGLLPIGRAAARIVTVYTPTGERCRGYAGALTAAIVDHARRSGIELVSLDVAVDDPHARRAYERAGFRAVGRHAVWTYFRST
jgi:ribosomal protein S18 acetylase RimI-like enzyme